MTRQPIIVDFTAGRAYRAQEQEPSLFRDLLAVVRQFTKRRRVVTTVEGIPPQVLDLPHR